MDPSDCVKFGLEIHLNSILKVTSLIVGELHCNLNLNNDVNEKVMTLTIFMIAAFRDCADSFGEITREGLRD